MKTFGFFVTLLLALNVHAQNYGFLGEGKIGLCPGAAPRVLQVEVVASIQPGGCCGVQLEWRQGQKLFFKTLDLRDEVENRIRSTVNLAALAYGANFVDALDPAPLVAERYGIDDAQVSICISKFDIVNLAQNRRVDTNLTLDLGYKVYVTMGPAENRKTRLVQELGGRYMAHTEFFFLFINEDLQAGLLLKNSWEPLKNHFSAFLVPVANEEATRGMQFIRSLINDFTENGDNR